MSVKPASGPCPSVPAAEHAHSVLVQLVLNLLQLCKLAVRHPGGARILGTSAKNPAKQAAAAR